MKSPDARLWGGRPPPRAFAAVFAVGLLTACGGQRSGGDPAASGTWWEDRDGDGFGDPNSSLQAAACPDFYADPSKGADCNDALSTAHPHACDLTGNGLDEDCDGLDGARPIRGGTADRDRDGYTAESSVCPDCNDDDPVIFPGALDATLDGVDQDCDGSDGPPPTLEANQIQPGQLIITELFFDTTHADGRAEWFEVLNASGSILTLEGLQIGDAEGGSFVIDDARLLPPFALLVFAPTTGAAPLPGTQTYQGLRLRREGALEIAVDGRLIDRVACGTDPSFPFGDGASTTLYPWFTDHQANDRGDSWCLGRSRGHFDGLGTPGLENDLCIPRGAPGYRDSLTPHEAQPDMVPAAAPGPLQPPANGVPRASGTAQ